jgi:glycosyltransferase involved in cell wall biosynthesis
MYTSFISVVALACQNQKILAEYVRNVSQVLKENFSDHEIILVNNGFDEGVIRDAFADLDPDVKKDITLLNLSRRVRSDNAIVAGLDRSNGDYTVLLDLDLYGQAGLIVDLYEKTQENYDIVYLRYRKRKLPAHKYVFYKAFYYLMNKYAELDMDINDHNDRIISRRALNSLLRMRENLRYTRGMFYYVGYRSCPLVADIPQGTAYQDLSGALFQDPNPSFKSALVAIFSFTAILRKLLLTFFIIALAFSSFITLDAVMIKLLGKDLLGVPQVNSKVDYLTILISVMFSLLFFILYIFSIYLLQINRETRGRPLYFIESVQRIE